MIDYDLKKIRAIIFDVDGVLSCDTVTVDTTGEPLRSEGWLCHTVCLQDWSDCLHHYGWKYRGRAQTL